MAVAILGRFAGPLALLLRSACLYNEEAQRVATDMQQSQTRRAEPPLSQAAASPLRRNILIFSDGTGQAGGLFPDELRSNIYKLYRATRCGPDTSIKAAQQIAFYDPGLGSQANDGQVKYGWRRRIYNFLSQATGLGITANIIDCYAAILKLWRPGDRIYVFGFSRGAYTVRCLGGVLAYCGVPTRNADGTPLLRNSENVQAIATEAVKQVYQYKGSIEGNPFAAEREEAARKFREKYGAANGSKANAVPYFIGVFDTVASVGAPVFAQWLVGILALGVLAAICGGAYWYFWSFSWKAFFYPPLGAVGVFGLWYLFTHLYWHREHRKLYLANWRMTFNDRRLSRDVRVARHALSIDESRADFARVEWAWDEQSKQERSPVPGETEPLRQEWFAGNHSDIGGSYSENESRLSDIALQWMVEQTQECLFKIQIDPHFLNLSGDPSGPQHDQSKIPMRSLGFWRFRYHLRWKTKLRRIQDDAPLHPTVIDRFKFEEVLVYDEMKKYRPENLRSHGKVTQYY